jgi:hypothetical protein
VELSQNSVVADGAWRLQRGQKATSSESIENKYAAELAKAGPAEKREIYQRMSDEIEKRRKMADHKPSAKTLW